MRPKASQSAGEYVRIPRYTAVFFGSRRSQASAVQASPDQTLPSRRALTAGGFLAAVSCSELERASGSMGSKLRRPLACLPMVRQLDYALRCPSPELRDLETNGLAGETGVPRLSTGVQCSGCGCTCVPACVPGSRVRSLICKYSQWRCEKGGERVCPMQACRQTGQ